MVKTRKTKNPRIFAAWEGMRRPTAVGVATHNRIIMNMGQVLPTFSFVLFFGFAGTIFFLRVFAFSFYERAHRQLPTQSENYYDSRLPMRSWTSMSDGVVRAAKKKIRFQSTATKNIALMQNERIMFICTVQQPFGDAEVVGPSVRPFGSVRSVVYLFCKSTFYYLFIITSFFSFYCFRHFIALCALINEMSHCSGFLLAENCERRMPTLLFTTIAERALALYYSVILVSCLWKYIFLLISRNRFDEINVNSYWMQTCSRQRQNK